MAEATSALVYVVLAIATSWWRSEGAVDSPGERV